MNSQLVGLYLSPEHWSQMEADVRSKAPEEGCGIVAGETNHARIVIPVTNILHSMHRFRMDPQEELRAFYLVEEMGLDVLAVYHSHPNGMSKPSTTDFAELTFPGIIYLIWYEQDGDWYCRGYKMKSKDESSVKSIIIELE